jgi:hypothetical protein
MLLIDRIASWGSLSPVGAVEPFVYIRPKLLTMAAAGHHLLTVAQRGGIVLYDKGYGAKCFGA